MGIFASFSYWCSHIYYRGQYSITDLQILRGPPKHYHALNALALRNERIYVADRPVIPSSDVSVYLDIEGIPDRDFYYLGGVLILNGKENNYHSFWADNSENEEEIWCSFLSVMDSIDSFTLYHYGSYESVYLDRMQKKYGGADTAERIKSSAVNVLSLVYSHVYFPWRLYGREKKMLLRSGYPGPPPILSATGG